MAKSGLFNSKYYLETYSDLQDKTKIPFLHFMRRGWREGRNPSDLFDTSYYQNRYGIVTNPVIHFLSNPQNFSTPIPKIKLTHQESFNKVLSDEARNDNDLVFWCKGEVPEKVKEEMLRFPVEAEFGREPKLGVLLPNGAVFETPEPPLKGWISGKSLKLRYQCFWIRGDLLKAIRSDKRLFRIFSEDEIWQNLPVVLGESEILYREIDGGSKCIKELFLDADRPKLTPDYRAISYSSKHKMSVAAVVLNYNCASETKEAVYSVLNEVDHVYVVDNHSEDFEQLKFDTGVTIIRNSKNTGYAGGNNLGIKRAIDEGFSHILVMNPDSRFSEVKKMLSHFRDSSDIGIVSPRILREDRSTWYGGFEIDEESFIPRQITDVGQGQKDLRLFTGCVFMASARCFEAVGLLPEEYFLYFEDCDYGLTVSSAGFRILFDPEITATHHQTSTGREDIAKPHYIYYFIRNRIKFIKKWAPQKLPTLFSRPDPFILGHRDKVKSRRPEHLDEFDSLVERAVKDGLNDISGASF